MSDDTPPRKKSKFADLRASPQADARAWSTYNARHDEINMFIKGMHAHAHACCPFPCAVALMQTTP